MDRHLYKCKAYPSGSKNVKKYSRYNAIPEDDEDTFRIQK